MLTLLGSLSRMLDHAVTRWSGPTSSCIMEMALVRANLAFALACSKWNWFDLLLTTVSDSESIANATNTDKDKMERVAKRAKPLEGESGRRKLVIRY